MQHLKINYKGYVIAMRIDSKSHCASIYFGGQLIKMVAGAIFADGSNDAIKKSKNIIDKF